jgi:Protein of unknown function (DUF3365)
MCRRPIIALAVAAFCALPLGGLAEQSPQAEAPAGIPPHVVAAYIYALVQADRTLYTTHVVERMEELGKAVATEEWKKQGGMPLPVQMLLMAAEDIKGQGINLRIRLASLSPINKANGPIDDFERIGLQHVATDPKRPYSGMLVQDDQRVFKAIYADRAITQACLSCHNGQGSRGKPNFKLYDVMGGIIISFPIP